MTKPPPAGTLPCDHCGERPATKLMFTIVIPTGGSNTVKSQSVLCDACSDTGRMWMERIGLTVSDNGGSPDWDVMIERLAPPNDEKQTGRSDTKTRPDDTQNADEPDHDQVPCFDCDGTTRTVWNTHTFKYGFGDRAAEITVDLPVNRCPDCGGESLGHEAETLKHRAVCAHLGVLAPDKVRAIRERHNLSSAEFSKLTGIEEATLVRWEAALLIQSVRDDRYLRLLRNAYTMEMLRTIAGGGKPVPLC